MDKKELLSSPIYNKKPAKQGRRAAGHVDNDIGSPDDLLDSSVTSSPTRNSKLWNEPVAPPRSRKTGGWADETSAKSKGSRRNSNNFADQDRLQSPERNQKQDSEDEIPLIPDLDEMQEEETLNQVARAPSVIGTKVASFSDLDSDLTKKSVFSTLDNINLSLLTSRLCLEEEVQEPNNAWTWDLLFTEVASDLRSEWEKEVYKD
ncbi:intraflagellar transport protein 43 homolog A-like [Macrosteles quadrilineatus]|uniref:intraflagellar transport protein 43 homolog A-like n=1 Tax=Macrosteles quadrilineatus TaxID=74068 RepID=UPI0023E27341|nr:intraflagellar transport protein 43 homolog A-like [Macrosteles quadrilineatus]